MTARDPGAMDRLLNDLQERAKELNCLYRVEEVLNNNQLSLPQILSAIIPIIPTGWRFTDICQVQIIYENSTYQSPPFSSTPWSQKADIRVDDKVTGTIEIAYSREVPATEEGFFLKDESKLLHTIADRIGQTIFHRQIEQVSREWETAKQDLNGKEKSEWMVIIDLLRRTDQKLFILIARKMIYYLFWNGVKEAKELLENFGKDADNQFELQEDLNRPSQKQSLQNILSLSDDIFKIADQYLSDVEILTCIQKWIQEDKASFLNQAVHNIDLPLAEIIDAITRYHYVTNGKYELSVPTEKGLRVSLIRRFFSDQLEFINIAKQYVEVKEFYQLVQRIIFPVGGYGRLGGKSAGLFLAQQILTKTPEFKDLLSNLKFPKTWYVTSDTISNFLDYNNLEEVIEQKYKEIDQIRLEYPNVVQLLKNSHFPPEIIKGLSLALDDFGPTPLIVRSSSLLEDRMGTAFSGKYKSLFLANQGSKQERLEALTDAIAEVYASIFGPDPIEYRAERGLLDFHEEMGIMIQEVVGTRIGHYFFPTYAGVAFSNNEFRWSARIKRDDGLIRLVPGLGTRAVDRVSDDYPVLISPGQAKLRANVTPEEIKYYSPRKIDAINLENRTFETIAIPELLKKLGDQIPSLQQIVSIAEDDHITHPGAMDLDLSKGTPIVTFEGLITRTPFIKQIQFILKTLQAKMATPVDIEFACDGKNFYLLQCRPQSSASGNVASPIPRDLNKQQIVFTANRYVSNGRIPDISHIVYVDPEQYNRLEKLSDMVDVGRAVGKLNAVLPKRQFILMGPGRWGSRGDIKLGVQVTYSDFNNTAALIEIARKKGNYLPELSFGTHFFQDLVEANIRYLPLYPDDPDIVFNESFLTGSANVLADLLPEFAHLQNVIRVIDVPQTANGSVLRVLMNADQEEAVGFIGAPASAVAQETGREKREYVEPSSDDHWRWRLRMAEQVAAHLDGERFGVKAVYLFGSTKNATAGMGSDIDLLVHFQGSAAQKQELLGWLEGWSLSLAEINFLRTGYRSDGLLDVHLVTDEDISRKTSYAVKIGAVTDAARPLPMKK